MASTNNRDSCAPDLQQENASPAPEWEDLLENGTAWLTGPETKLSSDENIRLLTIQSITNGLVECFLVECPLGVATQAAGGYHAISYCWGDAPLDQEILIDGVRFFVTISLIQALKAAFSWLDKPNLTAKIKGHNYSRVLWIDGLCINQRNVAEKSVQVRRMDEIYSGATTVLACLGEQDNEAGHVIWIMRWIEARKWVESDEDDITEEQFETAKQDLESCTDLLLGHYSAIKGMLEVLFRLFVDSDRLGESISDPLHVYTEEQQELAEVVRNGNTPFDPDSPLWPAASRLMSEPWFTRVWTLQEIRLARNATILCGEDYCVDWIILRSCRFVLYYLSRILRFLDADYAQSLRYFFKNDQSGMDFFINLPSEGEASPDILRFYLNNWGSRRARDPRDYVFGVLGLLEPDISSRIKVDYRLSTSQVFANATKVLAELPSGVEYWCNLMEKYKDHQRDSEYHLRTWCPDFSGLSIGDGILSEGGWQEVNYATARGIECNSEASFDERGGMKVPVIFLEKVASSVKFSPPSMQDFEVGNLFLETSQKWFAAMATMFTAGGIDLKSQLPAWIHTWIFNHSPYARGLQAPRFEMLISKSFRDKLTDPDFMPEYDGGFYKEVIMPGLRSLEANRGKHFFITRKGQLGYSSRPTNSGDCICYFPGGRYLHVLSARRDQYVAAASIDGFMEDALLKKIGTNPEWKTTTLY